MDELIQAMNNLCEAQPFVTGWYLKNLRTGEIGDRNGNVIVPSASTRKISILMAALKAVNEGRIVLDQPVTIQAKYQNNKSGTFQYLQPGFAIQFRDALVMMIIVSDNTCTGTVVDMIGLDDINAFCRAVGMKGTSHRYGIPTPLGRDHPLDAVTTTTPADTGRLLDLMLQGTTDQDAAAVLGCNTALCQFAIDILSWQVFSWRLPALLPLGTKVAHKTGRGKQWRNNNDAGIIFNGDEPLFILSV